MATNDYVYLKNVNGQMIKPVTDLSAINMTTTNGIAVDASNGGTIGIRSGYIENCVVTELSQPDQQATPEEAYVNGGTIYTLLGGYEISNDVPSENASPYKVPSEVAVRAAIDAYVATGGTDIVQGTGINVSGGSINMNIAGTDEVLTSTKTGTNTLDEDEAVTPANLRGALSIGQAVDVSCAPYNNTGTVTYSADGFLGGFTAAMVSGTTIGYYNTGDQKFPKFAPNLKYLMIADVSGTGTVTPNGYDDVVLSGTPQRIAMVVTAQDTGYISAAAAATLTVKNWRQYEVTALTPDAIQYLADYGTTPTNNPIGLDPLFREANIYAAQNIRDKYLVKQDMVCPFIPVIGMSNSDLTIAAGLAYQMTITDDEDHYFTADTIPTNGYGWDSHLQLFVNDLAKIHFQPPLNLVDPLTPNAAHNITVKWRSGQANVYVDDTDVGYIITVTSGTDEGSLAYGLTTSDSGYIIFSRTTDGTPVSATVTTMLSRPVIVMGHGAGTTSIAGSITVTTSATNSLLFTMLTIDNMTLNGNVSVTGVDFGTATISGGTVKATENNSVSGVVTVNGKLALDANSVLDLSENSANVPISGTGTVAVPSGTAYVIPYGSSVSVGVTGTGNAVNKYGKCGYLVSDASATTGTGTLYSALVGGGASYSNVIFDPALDGSTIGISGGTASDSTGTRHLYIYGNGKGSTLISGDIFIKIKYTTIKDCSIHVTSNICIDGNIADAQISITDCVISGVTTGGYAGGILLKSSAATITGCTISGFTGSYGGAVGAQQSTNVLLENCLLTGNTGDQGGAVYSYGTGATALSVVTVRNCVITGNSGSHAGIYSRNYSHVIVEGTTISGNVSPDTVFSFGDGATDQYISFESCTIDDPVSFYNTGGTIIFKGTNTLNSTVSGDGIVEFTNGATVTSTIPEGSTMGTGAIECGRYLCKFVSGKNATLENLYMRVQCRVDASSKTVFKNCVFDLANMVNGSICILWSQWSNAEVILEDCTCTTANRALGFGTGSPTIYVKNCTFENAVYLFNYKNGSIVMQETNSISNFYSNVSDYGTVSQVYWLMDGSVTSCTTASSLDTANGDSAIKVGVLDATTNKPRLPDAGETATATIIISGHTYNVSGTGTYINPETTPPTDLTYTEVEV